MSESENNPGLVSKDRDPNLVTNPIFVTPSDGTVAQNFSGTSADVNVTNTVTVSATDLDIRDLTHVSDSVRIGDGTNTADLVVINSAYGATPTVFPIGGKFEATPTTYDDGDAVPFLMDENGRLEVNATISNASVFVDDSAFTVAVSSVTGVGMLADEVAPDSVDEGDIGIPRMTLDRKQLVVLVDEGTDGQRLTINANGEAEVNLQDHNIGNTNPIPISRTTVANSETNPIFVQEVDQVASGNEVHDYLEHTALAADTEANHDYTAVGTFFLKMVTLSATGAARVEVILDPAGGNLTKRVVHLTGRQGDSKEVNFSPPVEVTTGLVIRARVKNRQGSANDIHSTINGFDV